MTHAGTMISYLLDGVGPRRTRPTLSHGVLGQGKRRARWIQSEAPLSRRRAKWRLVEYVNDAEQVLVLNDLQAWTPEEHFVILTETIFRDMNHKRLEDRTGAEPLSNLRAGGPRRTVLWASNTDVACAARQMLDPRVRQMTS